LAQSAAQVYEEGIHIALLLAQGTPRKKHYQEQAFYFAEKSKVAILLEALSDTKAKKFAQVPEQLLETERQLNQEITLYEQKLATQQQEADRETLFQLKKEREKFVAQLEKDFPQYYNLKYNPYVVSSTELQERLDAQTLLVSYFQSVKYRRWYLFVVQKKGMQVLNLPLSADFSRKITGLRNAIVFRDEELFVELNAEILPAALLGKSKNQLVVIPDAALNFLPFEVLFTQKPKTDKALPYLLLEKAIRYDYSLTLYHSRKPQEAVSSEKSALLYAPVTFEKMPALSASEREVRQIDSLFKHKNLKTQVQTHQNATKTQFLSDSLPRYRCLHIATHGIVDSEAPELSQVVFRAEEQNDGILYAGEIYNLSLQANLVSISACQTGLGKLQKGEGLLGLSRAFTFAGAENLLVSLWSVADESTAEVMVDFYEKWLIEGHSYPVALQQAKIKMLQQSPYSSPYYWAAFILIGK
jgi:CHAT domain-containing protein